MKLSYNWLKEYVDTDLSPVDMADVLTMLGLETEGAPVEVGGVEGNFEGVVVGEVLTAGQHPNADRLSVCTVNVGGEEPLHIVCGAPNVAAGQKVAVATVGTMLYPFGSEESLKIKKGKIRGEVSLGMICAEDELGLGPEHDGILVLDPSAKVGTPFIEVAPIERDFMIEIDLTPNRIDSASHYGTARDLAAHLGIKAKLPVISLGQKGENPIPVTIEATDKCKRYSSIHISGISVGESPDWLKKRLTTIGLRPRNNVVDITNYVLHELGQPMHAFDADKLEGGKIIVRTVDKPEKFITLDEEERTLLPGEDLLICDAKHPRCIAGTMGGLNSSVTEETKNVFLEAAYFDPGTVRKQAKRLAINSDSSYRFERGADPHMTVMAARRAASLIVELCGGTASETSDIVLDDFAPFDIDLSVSRTETLIGKEIGKTRMVEILNLLGITVEENADSDTLHLKVPPYRVDVTRPQDVMEEILRIYGYDSVLPSETLTQTVQFKQYHDVNELLQRYSNYLSANGFYEILNNSLVPKDRGDDKAIHMVNPLGEELEVMRQTLLHGALETIVHNQNRKIEDLALYEFGKTYWQKDGEYREKQWMAMAVTGQKAPLHWTGKGNKATLFTLTREVERMQDWFGFNGKMRPCDHPNFDYGMEMVQDGKVLLQYGKVNEELTAAYDIRNEVFYLEADWQQLVNIYFSEAPQFSEISQFPGIRRDISLMLDEGQTFDEIRQLIQRANPKLIREVELHDVYKGKNMDPGKKSYLVSVLFQDDRKTLVDKSVDKITAHIFRTLEKELGAEIRK